MAVSDLPSAHALLGRFAQRSTERHPHASLHSCLFLCSNWWWYWDSSRLHFRPPFKEARVVQISGCGTSTPRCEPREIAIHYLIHCTKNAKRLRVNVRIQVMMHELKEREKRPQGIYLLPHQFFNLITIYQICYSKTEHSESTLECMIVVIHKQKQNVYRPQGMYSPAQVSKFRRKQ